jgi:hypothetical protein
VTFRDKHRGTDMNHPAQHIGFQAGDAYKSRRLARNSYNTYVKYLCHALCHLTVETKLRSNGVLV